MFKMINKNKKDILMSIYIFVIVLSLVIIKTVADLDEVWNYNTARAISTGLIPYKDVSLITTPLLPIITAVLLKLTVNELIVSRFFTAIIWTGILMTIYKIFKRLIKEDNACYIFTFLIGIFCRNIFCIDYNVLSLFITLIILYYELKNCDNKLTINIKYELIIRNIIWISYMYKTKFRYNSFCCCCYI